MKRKHTLKAGILLAILLLILPVSVESAQAGLHIDSITGGVGVHATISATTTEINVEVTFSVAGGFLPFYRVYIETVPRIDPGTPQIVKGRFLGFGNIIITVTAKSLDSSATDQLTGGPTHLFIIFTW
jgi:hypothetical protein